MLNIEDIKNTVICADCLDILRQLPDKCVDLVLTDPPYGIHDKISAKGCSLNHGNKFAVLYDQNPFDKKRPDKTYFKELFRISKNQIICGANYFVEHLPVSRGWVFWDKMGDGVSSVNNELIFTSFDVSIKTFRRCHGLDKGFMTTEMGLHPTQKPTTLFVWLLEEYSKPGDLILDCYLGSGTTAVACKRTGRNFIGIEISPEYCETSRARILQAETGVTVKEQKAGQKPLFE